MESLIISIFLLLKQGVLSHDINATYDIDNLGVSNPNTEEMIVFEDGSFIYQNISGCIPSKLCSFGYSYDLEKMIDLHIGVWEVERVE